MRNRAGQQSSEVQSKAEDAPAGATTTGAEKYCKEKSVWAAFCAEWNDKLYQHPIFMVVLAGGAYCLTLMTIGYCIGTQDTLHDAFAAPEYAVGWLFMRATAMMREPLNCSMAAVFSALMPWLPMFKLTPLISATSVFANHVTQGAIGSPRAGALPAWVEKPVDKYGCSYLLAGKITGMVTLGGATAAAMYGVDVRAILSQWGMSTDLQNNTGLLAISGVINTFLIPLHFYIAVVGVRWIDRRSKKHELRLFVKGWRVDAIQAVWNKQFTGDIFKQFCGRGVIDGENLFGAGDFTIDVAGAVVVMSRGEISFGQMVRKAAAAGAVAAVIFSNQDAQEDRLVKMSLDAGEPVPTIPALYVTKASGLVLIDELYNGPVEIRIGVEP